MATSEPHWHPEALADVENAREWYAQRSPLAARGFLLALEEALGTVIEAPQRFPVGKYGCRRCVFPNKYPFTLVYRLSPSVEIIAAAHHKRHPDYWAQR